MTYWQPVGPLADFPAKVPSATEAVAALALQCAIPPGKLELLKPDAERFASHGEVTYWFKLRSR